MPKIIVDVDCGNAPKRILLKNWNIAFAEGNIAFLLEHATDDIVWEMVGDKVIEGKAAFKATLEEMKTVQVEELKIQKVITHGREGALSGEMILVNGEKYAFCDVYQFKGAKGGMVKALWSYVLKVK